MVGKTCTDKIMLDKDSMLTGEGGQASVGAGVPDSSQEVSPVTVSVSENENRSFFFRRKNNSHGETTGWAS